MRLTPRSRRLLFLPLLLLVPLGVAKWRADHPPLSRADKELRADIDHLPWVCIIGDNSPTWHKVMGLTTEQCILVKDRAALHEITETLRLTERRVPVRYHDPQTLIQICVPSASSSFRLSSHTFYSYLRTSQGSFLQRGRQWEGAKDGLVVVQPRFAPRFEAFIADLAHRAKALGKHPNITLISPSWSGTD